MKKISRFVIYLICFSLIFTTCAYAAEENETALQEQEISVSDIEEDTPDLSAEEQEVPASENITDEAAETVPEETTDGAEDQTGEPSETPADDPADPQNTEVISEDPETEEPGEDAEQTDPQDPSGTGSPEDEQKEETEDPEETLTEEPAEETTPEAVEEEKTETKEETEETEVKETDKKKTAAKTAEAEETEEKTKKAAALAGEITVVSKNANVGRYTFALTGLEKAEDVTAVKYAIWCAEDQSDIKWYTAAKNEDGTYRVTMYKYLHQDHTGTYYAHVYADLKDGSSQFVAGKMFTINNPAATFTVTKPDTTYHFEANYIPRASEISYVKFAVWSSNNGKDDLKWYKATSYSKKTLKAAIDLKLTNHSDGGLYYATAWGITPSGAKIQIAGKVSFNVVKKGVLSCSGMKTSVNKTTGAFTITVTDVHSPTKIKNVQIAVWSKSNQSDLVWYTAKDKGGGKYAIGSKISKHNYNLGTYNAHVYVNDTKGNSKFLIGKSFKIKASAGAVKVGASKDERKYTATISSVVVPGGENGVQFAVWSDDRGQDDIVWYDGQATTTAGKYKATIDILNHKTAGTYNVHVYAITKSGANALLGATSFVVNPTASVTIKNTGLTDANGKFSCKTIINSSSSPVSSVKVRVWCKSDMSDQYWYKTVKNSSGQYVVTVNTMNHYGNRGTYNIESYITFANGIEWNAVSKTQTFKPKAYLKVAKSNGKSIRKVTYYNPDVTSVKFHVWTQRGGSADKHIYTGKKSSDGVFYVNVNMDNFTYDGQYNVKVYSGSTLLDSGSFIMIDYLEEGYKMALNNKIGYSQINRCLDPDVDCSSFVYYSLKNTGYNVPGGWPMTTYSEASVLQGAGFSMFVYTNVSDLQPGDILLRTEHTEIYAGNGKTVGAHLDENGDIYGWSSGDQTKTEVSEAACSENWIYAFRWVTYPM